MHVSVGISEMNAKRRKKLYRKTGQLIILTTNESRRILS